MSYWRDYQRVEAERQRREYEIARLLKLKELDEIMQEEEEKEEEEVVKEPSSPLYGMEI